MTDYKEIARKLWEYICIIDTERETYEELADAIGLSRDELAFCRRLEYQTDKDNDNTNRTCQTCVHSVEFYQDVSGKLCYCVIAPLKMINWLTIMKYVMIIEGNI